MLFVLHVGIISPTMMAIVPSIEMVLLVAIGGTRNVDRRGHRSGYHDASEE